MYIYIYIYMIFLYSLVYSIRYKFLWRSIYTQRENVRDVVLQWIPFIPVGCAADAVSKGCCTKCVVQWFPHSLAAQLMCPEEVVAMGVTGICTCLGWLQSFSSVCWIWDVIKWLTTLSAASPRCAKVSVVIDMNYLDWQPGWMRNRYV